jgi:hypothetical protein
MFGIGNDEFPRLCCVGVVWSYVPDEGGIPIIAAAYTLVPALRCGPLKGIGIGLCVMRP